MAIYTPGPDHYFGQLPDTPQAQPLPYDKFVQLVTMGADADAYEQVLSVVKHTVMSVSSLVCAPHALGDFHYQLLTLDRDECTRDVLLKPLHSEGHQRQALIRLQLSTCGELLYATDVTVRSYFPKML